MLEVTSIGNWLLHPPYSIDNTEETETNLLFDNRYMTYVNSKICSNAQASKN